MAGSGKPEFAEKFCGCLPGMMIKEKCMCRVRAHALFMYGKKIFYYKVVYMVKGHGASGAPPPTNHREKDAGAISRGC